MVLLLSLKAIIHTLLIAINTTSTQMGLTQTRVITMKGKTMKLPTKQEWADVLTQVLHNYEDLIDNYDENVAKWKEYGSLKNCRLCVTTDPDWEFRGYVKPKCHLCPLDGMRPPGIPCVTYSYYGLLTSLQRYDKEGTIKAAKVRYKEILTHIKKQGYRYE